MKTFKKLSVLIILAMLFVAVVPAYAQLGATDISSFTVQNVDTETATVTIHFYAENGDVVTPTVLNNSQPNPFDLAPGESWEVYLPAIPDEQLADGRYSVVIESSARVVTIANLIGQGDIYFNGSYSGFDGGDDSFFLPAVVYNFYGWYSLIFGRDAATLDQAATTIGRGTLAVKGDVSNLADLDRMYAEIGRAGSKLDGVFVNAGIAQFPSIADVTEAWFDRIVAINLKGAYSYCVIKNRVL